MVFDSVSICANMILIKNVSYMKKRQTVKNIGEVINNLRERKGMSQADLSTGILSKAQLSKF